MKHLLALLFTLFSSTLFAQTVGGIQLRDIRQEYIQIIGTGRFMSNKISIDIDFGQENKGATIKDTQLRDNDGKPLIFNSMIDALNFMTSNGYEFVQAYGFSTSTNQHIYHYLLKRKK